MNTIPKILMTLVIVMLVIFAVYSVTSDVVDNQGENLVNEGQNVEDGFDCVFSDRGSAQDCIETDSGDGDNGEG